MPDISRSDIEEAWRLVRLMPWCSTLHAVMCRLEAAIHPHGGVPGCVCEGCLEARALAHRLTADACGASWAGDIRALNDFIWRQSLADWRALARVAPSKWGINDTF